MYLCAILALILVLICLRMASRFWKPSGLMHIDEYTNKDAYRMLYFTPLEDLKKHRYVILKVETQKWDRESYDAYEEENY